MPDLLGEATYALILGSSRSIGGIIPDVVVEEGHRDGLLISPHPIEKGAVIQDHAFRRPSEVEMRVGFSNSSAGDPGYARSIYQEFLAWRDSRDLRDVATGKRLYTSMLPAEIGVQTDAQSENILMLIVRLQEIIITSTQTTNTGSDTTKPATSSGDQASPETTGGVADKGQQQAAPITDQSFAGSFNPGYQPGITGTTAETTPLPTFDGISPPSVASPTLPSDLPEVAPNAGNLNPGGGNIGGVTPYNPFVM